MPIPIIPFTPTTANRATFWTLGKELPAVVTALNAQSGTATLVAGSATVTGVNLTATSVIQLAYRTPAGTPGALSAPTASRTATSFVINSSSNTDTSTVDWSI